MMKIFFTSILLMIVILSQSQDIYYLTFANSNIVFHEDLRKGNTKIILVMKEASLAINFHPNGRLYSLSYNSVTEYDLRTGRSRVVSVDFPDEIKLTENWGVIIDEEGKVYVSGGKKNKQKPNYPGYIFSLDHRTGDIEDEIFYGTEQSYIFRAIIDGYFIPEYPLGGFSPDDEGFWVFDPVNKTPVKYYFWTVSQDGKDQILNASVLYGPCDTLRLVGQAQVSGEFINGLNILNAETSEIENVNDGIKLIKYTATLTDFRQSPLRIHLDEDQSSGHMTGGYYDTLTTCRKEVPIADEDIELFTCGAAVDSISFRLRYYDQPRLAEEYLTAEADGGTFRQTSPSRWVWKNSYGGDEAQIKDFLRSVRYHADWDPEDAEQSRERVVMTTMYVDGDSTTSWTVYQLEKDDEMYAGRDTLITYCPDAVSLDLMDYLSPEAVRGGRIEPQLSAEGSIFTPGVDEDTTYLYIVEEGECADTAELQVLPFMAENIDLDTVFLCPGERVMVGFPVDQYEVTWWDGSRGDSIWVTPADAGSRRVSIQFDDCGIQAEMEVIVRDLSGQAGEEREIFYCEGEAEISLLDSFPEFPGMEGRIEGLSDGIFRPGVDDPGKYAYILSMGSCADTAIITLTPSADREIFPGEVVLCADETRWIGFATGTYNEIIWENGVQGDSVEITSDQTGPFGFEALRSGCRYYGTFEIVVQPELSFPEIYPDTVRICRGEESRIPVEELDSVWWEGRMYQEGEELVFTEEGDFTLTGYMNGCAAEKEIAVEVISDPAANYHILTELCEGEETEIRLPEETNDLRFEWKDGSAEPVRRVDQPGEYPFSILAGDCVFEGAIEVIEQTDCDPVVEECEISIPNVIVLNGENHTLRVYATCEIGVQEIRIYDRWGGQRYVGQEEEVGYEVWERLPPDVYLVEVIYEQAGKGVRKMTESVMVIR